MRRAIAVDGNLPPRAPRWAWVLPRLAAILVPIVIGALLWLLHHNDLDDQRTTMISDVLWLEQNLRFQMERNLEQLRLLNIDTVETRATPTYDARAQALIQNGSGLVQIVRLDRIGRLRSVTPAAAPDQRQRLRSLAVFTEASRRAVQLDKPIYSKPFNLDVDDPCFAIFVPHYNDRPADVIVGVYSVHALLYQMVPWWFTEKYRVSVMDANGATLSSKSRVQTSDSDLSYQVAFDPPGQGYTLAVVAYHHGTRLLPALLMMTIVLLTVAILVSLWAVKRHVQRRHVAEKALREEYAFRKAMEDSLLTGLRARDLDGYIVYVNPAFCQMVGWSADELIGREPPMPYWAPEEMAQTLTVYEQIMAGTAPHEAVELRFQRKNGERFDALIYEAPLIDANGVHHGWMASMLDITERKRAEERYRQQQDKLQFTARLVTMGEMASTLAHELNQPLSAISSYATGCLNLLDDSNGAAAAESDVVHTLRKVVAQAQRAGQVIRRVHEFVRRREPMQEPCAINTVVEDATGLIEVAARWRGVRLQLDLAPNLPPVQVDKVMIEQLLLNLIRNGMDAMAQTVADQRLLVVATVSHERGVCVSVSDRGPGIAPAVAAQLYEPFFSTKQEGMGMGLNICRSIAELHHGRLWFEERANGNGTTFSLWLPVE
ncbi:MAG: PAS domain S-box protein [Gammaproteobacteria bacterium]|nr:PAS domain S-box protein [Gammaproteobacteria bacterium]